MKSLLLLGASLWYLVLLSAASPPPGGAAVTGEYPNLLKTYLGKTEAESDAKLAGAFQQLFYGDPFTERIYDTASPDTAYLADAGSRDIRSEGISYGKMIAVQMDKQAEFNTMWKWAKPHLFCTAFAGPRVALYA
jgi:oligosaccharide reducing-end xylanase